MKAALTLTLAAAVFGAGNANAQSNEFSVPTYAGAYQPQGVDEQGLWAEDDESERALLHSPLVIRDVALNDYVRGVLCRTVGEERCRNVRLYILRVPEFNANMSVNGTMRVYSGLLLRMRSEAELANVLAHEFAHFELRHGLASFRAQRTAGDILAWSAILTAVAARAGTQTQYGNDRITIIGNLYTFNRNQERAADILGFGYLASASYRPAAAADVWRTAMNEADAGARSRGQRSTRYNQLTFFATHPTNLERADTLALLANRVSGGDRENRNEYAAALAPWISAFLSDEVKLNNFGGTEFLLGRLATDGWTGELLFARGELYRTRGAPRDLVNAADFYRDALKADPNLIEAHRGLGLSLLRSGSLAEGQSSIATYLAARPDAPDQAMLRSLLPSN